MAISRIMLSGSSFGEPILVSTTGTTGIVIHQASTTAANIIDEVWLYGCNLGSAAHSVYLLIAGSTLAVGGAIQPSVGDLPVAMMAGNCLKSSTAAVNSVLAYGTTGANLALYGHVNRIST